jgi:hypothetical protein
MGAISIFWKKRNLKPVNDVLIQAVKTAGFWQSDVKSGVKGVAFASVAYNFVCFFSVSIYEP